MEGKVQELYKCDNCSKIFKKLGEYNQHRKRHDRPYACSFCKKAFGSKTDLDRHRKSHLNEKTRKDIYCKIPGCKFRGTRRKDYLWAHLQRKHLNFQDNFSGKTLREYYKEITKGGEALQNELDLELLEASQIGDTERIHDLLLRGVDISTKDSAGETPFILAVNSGKIEVVEILINNGESVNSTGKSGITPLLSAIYKGDAKMVRFLLEKDVDISPKFEREIAFRSAIKSGNIEVVGIFVENGVNVNLKEDYWGPPLCEAALKEDVEMANFLLEKGADVNLQRSCENETALHMAARNSEVLTRFLLKAGANIEAKDSWGATPLTESIGFCHSWERFNSRTAKLLLEAGATVKEWEWNAMPLCFQQKNAKYNPYLSSSQSFQVDDTTSALQEL